MDSRSIFKSMATDGFSVKNLYTTLMALLLSCSCSILLEQLLQLQLLQNSPFAKQSQYLQQIRMECLYHGPLWFDCVNCQTLTA